MLLLKTYHWRDCFGRIKADFLQKGPTSFCNYKKLMEENLCAGLQPFWQSLLLLF